MSSGRSMGVKDSRSTPGCGGVNELVIVHPERATGFYCLHFVIEKANKIVTDTGLGTLCSSALCFFC